ncbi:MAG: tetratricopeptide repeat protein [Acidobacteriota bacterium]|nr:tetratricopeptide repeat protein [Acidobacteriota bacterium]
MREVGVYRVPSGWAGVAAVFLCAGVASTAEIPSPDLEGVEARVEEAIGAARQAVADATGDADSWGRYGMILDAHHLPTEAAAAYREAFALDDRDVRWPYLLATLLEYSGPEEALGWYERATALDSAYAPSRIRYAQALEVVGRDADAEVQYRSASDLDPTDPLGPLGLGRLALAAGRVEEAVRHLEQAYRIDAGIQATVATLARAYALTGDREAARQKAQEARSLPRTLPHKDSIRAGVEALAVDSTSYLRRSRTYADVGDLSRARAEVEAVLDFSPDHAQAWFLAAGLYDRTGDAAKALHAVQKALAADPDLAVAKPVLASALFKLERFDEAEPIAAEVLEEDPDNLHMLVLSAMGAAQRNEIDLMIGHLDHAYAMRNRESLMAPVMAQLFVDLAAAFADVGRYPEAAQRMAQALTVIQETGAPPHELREYRQQLDRYRRAR